MCLWQWQCANVAGSLVTPLVAADKAQVAESKNRLRRLLDEADDAVTMVRNRDYTAQT